MQLTDAFIEIGRRDQETWAVRAENVRLTYRDLGIGEGLGYKVVIDDNPLGFSGHNLHTLISSRLPVAFSWLTEHGKRDLLFSDVWQITDPDELP